jgi:hypothetical protein
MEILHVKLANGKKHTRIFIPSKVQNNRVLLEHDPDYINRLYLVGSPDLVKAWLEGDWSAIAGAFFPEFSMEKHVFSPFPIPRDWIRFRAFDWGSARPFSCGWYAISDGSMTKFPRGAILKFKEWYGSTGEPNVGLRLTAEEVADGILRRDGTDKIEYSVADPAIFSSDGGPSIGERFFSRGLPFRRADNARVGRSGHMGGWDMLRARLKGDGDGPMIYFSSSCVDTIRCLPALQHDSANPEDVDSDMEDHAPDETRYACMSRPWTPKLIEPEKPKFFNDLTFDEIVDRSPSRNSKRI